MVRPYEVPSEVEKITDGSISRYESLSLFRRLELPHPLLSYPGRFVQVLKPGYSHTVL